MEVVGGDGRGKTVGEGFAREECRVFPYFRIQCFGNINSSHSCFFDRYHIILLFRCAQYLVHLLKKV